MDPGKDGDAVLIKQCSLEQTKDVLISSGDD